MSTSVVFISQEKKPFSISRCVGMSWYLWYSSQGYIYNEYATSMENKRNVGAKIFVIREMVHVTRARMTLGRF